MLINPTYGAGGAQSSGYVEDELVFLYDGNTQSGNTKRENIPKSDDSDGSIIANTFNSSDGATIEGYIVIAGASSNTYSRAFTLITSSSSAAFCIGFGNTAGSSNSQYHVNMMCSWGVSLDYELFIDDLFWGDKHTFAMVSIPDVQEVANNRIAFYIDGEQVGATTYTQRREEMISPTAYGIEGGTFRPLNGTLHSGRFYNRALTAAELAANHANDIAKYGGNS